MIESVARYRAPFGPLTLVARDGALAAVWFSSELAKTRARDPVRARATSQLDEYFAGRRATFDLPLDERGTPFQRAVWSALSTIPCGETTSYAAIARAIGRPSSVRAVGAANGRNPLAIVVPCHRVIGNDGSLTGYAGGLAAKKWLLDHERAML